MRKLIAILLVVILALGGAAGIAKVRENGGLKSLFSSKASVANATPAPKQNTAEVTATPAPTSGVVLPTVEPTTAPTVVQAGMSFYEWLREAQNTKTGALYGTFDEDSATRVEFIDGEEITGYANFMVAGKYFSVEFEGRKLSGAQKANKGVSFYACDKHEGFFFDWHSKKTGDFIRYELTPELIEELKSVAVSWTDDEGNTVYGVLCCQHEKKPSNSGSSSSSKKPSNGGGDDNDDDHQPPVPTKEPLKIENPPVNPTPKPAENQDELENQDPHEEIDHDNGHSSDPAPKPADNKQELEAQGPPEKVDHDNGHTSDPEPVNENSGNSSSDGHSSDPAPKQENSGNGHSSDPAPKQENSGNGHSSDPAPKQENSGNGHSSDPEPEGREDLSISMDW